MHYYAKENNNKNGQWHTLSHTHANALVTRANMPHWRRKNQPGGGGGGGVGGITGLGVQPP